MTTPAEIARLLTEAERRGLVDAWACGTRLAEVPMSTVRSMFRKGLVKNDDGYCPPLTPIGRQVRQILQTENSCGIRENLPEKAG